MPDYVKQLKIGNSNYNIKAEKAANQNSNAAVVRDIEYGTNAPSGGESGQLYLQYDTSSSTNNYIYAEDTASDQQNVIDNYYSKSEINNLLLGKNYDYTGSWTNSSSTSKDFEISGEGFVIISCWVRAQRDISDTGTANVYIDLRSPSAYIRTLACNENRLASANTADIAAGATAGYYYDGTSENKRLRCYMGHSKNGTNTWGVHILTIGCNITML